MLRIPSDVLYFETGPDNPVTHRVQPGEAFEVQTQINRGPWIETLPEAEQAHWKAKLVGGNPSSGCIHVEGAKPGDMLRVELGPIALDPVAYTQFGGNNGAMPGWMEIGAHRKLVEVREGKIRWNEALTLDARPMLGFVGVSPERERFHNGWAGMWGGNLDAQEVTEGCALLLRVNVDGARLHVGDMHALQGDGEICGAGGLEASGVARLTCRLVSPAPPALRWPRFEDATHLGVIANARPAEDAFRHALVDLLKWLESDYRLPRGEAYMLLAQVLEARVTQFVNPMFTYLVKVAKKYLPKA
ncbi:MAG: acetamidase/formamidase family protein [Planctomycetota bacterium]|nr:acetamidase/formamidase family protein [Planctomycetota bacterium]